MLYNKKTVAKAIHANLRGLDEKIESYDGVKDIDLNHLLSWKKKNIETLHEMGHISDDEMEKYMTSGSYLFTPEIEIK